MALDVTICGSRREASCVESAIVDSPYLLLIKQRGSLASEDFLWAGLHGEASSLTFRSPFRADEYSSHKRYRGTNLVDFLPLL